MPIFDPVEQRMTVRVVYDGVAYAGKTTNLKQLGALFAAQRRTLVESPADLCGRTLYFDWMQITAGAVCGFPLACQVVSVPGQAVLAPRRRSLLMDADVVVFICESHAGANETTRAALAFYDEVVRERGERVPLVIQANKQDQPGAIDGATLVKVLEREGIPCVEAIAHEGIGVVDTFVAAIRTVVREIQARAESEALRVRVRCAETQTEVLHRTAREHIDPRGAAELLLEAASALFDPSALPDLSAIDAPTRAAAVELESITIRPGDVPSVPVPERVAPSPEADTPPELPSADVPTGFIWPAHTGRATIGRLSLGGKTASRTSDGWSTVAGSHVLSTSTHARYADVESARQALVRRAREHTQLGHLLVPETVLVAQPSADGCWIWSVRPDLPTVAQALRDGRLTPKLLGGLGVAIVEALRCGLRHGFAFTPTLDAFAVQQDGIRFIGDVTAHAIDAGAFSRAIGEMAAVLRSGADAASFMEAVQRELERRLTGEELAAFAVDAA